MRKAIVISLLFTLISIQTPLHEIFKVPVLITHYFEHKEQNNDLSLIDFFKLHYAESLIDSDHDRDMELPFKHCSAPIFVVFSILSERVSITLSPGFTDHIKVPLGYKNHFLSFNIQNNIWQPPKTV